jgi:hypothetical protein
MGDNVRRFTLTLLFAICGLKLAFNSAMAPLYGVKEPGCVCFDKLGFVKRIFVADGAKHR